MQIFKCQTFPALGVSFMLLGTITPEYFQLRTNRPRPQRSAPKDHAHSRVPFPLDQQTMTAVGFPPIRTRSFPHSMISVVDGDWL